jgi:hypothetical protein
VRFAVTPTELTQAAHTLRELAQELTPLPRGHGLSGRQDLLGSLDETHRLLADELHRQIRLLHDLAAGIDAAAVDYGTAENDLVAASTAS